MLETVAQRGYDRTTVSRVLSSSGVQEAVFGEHFHDKRNCFLVAIDELLGNVECAAVELFREPAAWPERVRLGLRSLLDALAEHPTESRVAFVEMLGAGPAACERGRAALALFAALMEEGRCYAPNPDQLPVQTSEAIVGGIVSIVHRRVLQGNLEELPSLHEDLTYFALLPYLDHERALAVATSL
jgi:AcrR family transcriptional regulator